MTFFFSKHSFWPEWPLALVRELQPEVLLASLIAGSLTGLIGVIRAISYAALIFSGGLAMHLNVGVGIAIFSSAAISIVVATTSSLPGMIATPLAAPTAVLAILAAQIVGELGATDPLLTVVAAIALGSLVTGLSLWLLGTCRAGRLLQVMPYPVVGGFMAATGWLLVRGGLQVMTDEAPTWNRLGWFLSPAVFAHWGTGLAIALALLIVTKRYQQSLLMPGILLGSTGLFYGALLWGLRLPLTEIRRQGWLLGPFPTGHLWQPLGRADLAQVHWETIGHCGGTLGLLVFVSLLSLILTNGGIELALGQELDINRELRAIGLANLVAGLGSTMVGNQALPSTLLVHKMGATSRLTGVFKALFCGVVLLLGPTFLAYFPKPVLGSLLLFLGLDLLWQWLYKAWFRLPWSEYFIVAATLAAIVWLGFVAGITAGFCLAALQFLYGCAIVPMLAAGGQPQAAAAADGSASLQAQTAEVDLQGFLFFGNAARLFQQVRSHLLHPTEDMDRLVLNFSAVLGADASAVVSLSKLTQLAKEKQVTLVFKGVSAALQQRLCRGQVLDLDSPYCQLEPQANPDTGEAPDSSTRLAPAA